MFSGVKRIPIASVPVGRVTNKHHAGCAPKGNTLMKAQTSCKTCRAGTYSSTRGRSTSCLSVLLTHLVDQNTPTSHDHETDCKIPSAHLQPLEGHGDACFQCPSATVQGSTTCDGCAPGQYKHEGEGKTLHVSSANEASTQTNETKALVRNAEAVMHQRMARQYTLCPGQTRH